MLRILRTGREQCIKKNRNIKEIVYNLKVPAEIYGLYEETVAYLTSLCKCMTEQGQRVKNWSNKRQ